MNFALRKREVGDFGRDLPFSQGFCFDLKQVSKAKREVKSEDVDTEVETKSTDSTGNNLYLKCCFHTDFTGISASGFSNLVQIGTAHLHLHHAKHHRS